MRWLCAGLGTGSSESSATLVQVCDGAIAPPAVTDIGFMSTGVGMCRDKTYLCKYNNCEYDKGRCLCLDGVGTRRGDANDSIVHDNQDLQTYLTIGSKNFLLGVGDLVRLLQSHKIFSTIDGLSHTNLL